MSEIQKAMWRATCADNGPHVVAQTIYNLQEAVKKLEAKLAKAVDALKWYATRENYAGKCDDYQDPNCPIWSETDNDCGTRAIAALKEITE